MRFQPNGQSLRRRKVGRYSSEPIIELDFAQDGNLLSTREINRHISGYSKVS